MLKPVRKERYTVSKQSEDSKKKMYHFLQTDFYGQTLTCEEGLFLQLNFNKQVFKLKTPEKIFSKACLFWVSFQCCFQRSFKVEEMLSGPIRHWDTN